MMQLVQNSLDMHLNSGSRWALQSAKSVSFSLIQTTSDLMRILPEIVNMHVSRWEILGQNSKYSDPRRMSFILEVCEEAIKDGTLFFPIMKVDDVLAAYIIGFRDGETIYDWNTSFSIDYSRWSPGCLLLLHVLTNSTRFRFSRYNLMKGLEDYKFVWTNVIEQNVSVKVNCRVQ